MVEFITLFLGAIITGPTDVQLMVNDEVAVVELRLDEESLGLLRRAPWQIEVDFSEELRPNFLEAIAFDDNGKELDRTRQWVNLAPHTAEVAIMLDRDPEIGTVHARLSWQSISAGNEPIRVKAVFDDMRVNVVDPRKILLPPHDPDSMHHLRVELEFAESLHSSAEVTFGGVFGDTISSELTPFPVDLYGVKKLPPVATMQPWFHSKGKPLTIHSTDKGLAEIIIVRDPSTLPILEAIMTRQGGLSSRRLLKKGHRLRFLGTQTVETQSGLNTFELFHLSPEIRVKVGGLPEALVLTETFDRSYGPPRLADAVAVAGLSANQSGRRRTVVLITTGATIDSSQSSPQQVIRYLRRLGVPLVVWNPAQDATEAGTWGHATSISSEGLLDSAYTQLARQLKRQRVVWFTGRHLPQTISLDPTVEGIKLVR